MKAFMEADFLLESETAKRLYHSYAKNMPILDYHSHINPREIAEDRRFENITRLWLEADHYKWRLMRSNGVEERYITGEASDWEKFQKWAETLEQAIGNPVYHWSHLELQRYFGYYGVLNRETAREVWELTCKKLAEPELSAVALLHRSKVTLLCTTDDPVDDLHWHKKIAEDKGCLVRVLPTWRPDSALALEKENYPDYIRRLSEAAEIEITDYSSLLHALVKRMDYFEMQGCRIADHGMTYVMCQEAELQEIEGIFERRLAGILPDSLEEMKFKTAFLAAMGREYHRRGWAMQLHYGVKRNNNGRLFRRLGADAGADSISSPTPGGNLADFLNLLEDTNQLPKTIIYSLNPADNAVVGTIVGCFQDSMAKGKIQQGSAWWFNDHKKGMEEAMTSLAALGLLGNFIGMLTDSRSLLSFTRHEYFRRILCNLIGTWVERGEYPAEELRLKELVQNITYYNALHYFGFETEMERRL